MLQAAMDGANPTEGPYTEDSIQEIENYQSGKVMTQRRQTKYVVDLKLWYSSLQRDITNCWE